MLSVSHVTKQYGSTKAVDDVSFELREGEVAAVIGANGAGKTTLIKCITGLLKFEGEVHIGDVQLTKNAKAARRQLGYVAQAPAFHPDMSVQEIMTFYAELKGVDLAEAHPLLLTVGLSDQTEKVAGALSGGMKQRLALAVALLGDPPLLVLDEPASGLDIGARIELRELITQQRAQGKAVLLSTHWLEDVPYVADQALVLDHGKLVFSGAASSLAGTEAAGSRLYLRLNGHSNDALPMIARVTGREVQRSGDWVVASCPPTQKAGIVASLIASGVPILDFRVEEASVDDAVLRLRKTKGGAQ